MSVLSVSVSVRQCSSVFVGVSVLLCESVLLLTPRFSTLK